VQLAALPNSVSAVHGLPSSQLVGHDEGGSHDSPGSITPLPQVGLQFGSLFELQPAGQQASLGPQAVIGSCWQRAVQLAALPCMLSRVQALPSSQLVGHDEGGSQVSPISTTPFPQVALQLGSLVALQPDGQQPSSGPQAVMSRYMQRAVQFSTLPTRACVVHGLPSSQLVGQAPARPAGMALSQASPGSTTPLPHEGEQSGSVAAEQPAAQQLS